VRKPSRLCSEPFKPFLGVTTDGSPWDVRLRLQRIGELNGTDRVSESGNLELDAAPSHSRTGTGPSRCFGPMGRVSRGSAIAGSDALVEQTWQGSCFTALLVTHDVEEAVTLADRVVAIDRGTIAFETAIPLTRPRRRDSQPFAALALEILSHVLGSPPSTDSAGE
jgi:hypothetical protein